MGMSIDESNRILVDRYIDTYVVCGGENYNPTINITRQDYEAFRVAIETMRKYQKIKEIISKWDGLCNVEVLGMLSTIMDEVLEDG